MNLNTSIEKAFNYWLETQCKDYQKQITNSTYGQSQRPRYEISQKDNCIDIIFYLDNIVSEAHSYYGTVDDLLYRFINNKRIWK